MYTCNEIKKGFYKRRGKIIKTLTWRIIATMTTFIVSYIVIGDVEKSGSVAAIDTVLKQYSIIFTKVVMIKLEKKIGVFVMMMIILLMMKILLIVKLHIII